MLDAAAWEEAARPAAVRCRQVLAASLLAVCAVALAQSRSNVFNDPFVQATSGLAACPTPDAPGVTEQEVRELAHDRSQRGVSCWLAGRCRLQNAYLYDAEIVPRVQQAIRLDGRFTATSIWATGQRRWVFLQGCTSTAEQAMEAEQLVGRIDDVEGVVNQLMVGTEGRPPYRGPLLRRSCVHSVTGVCRRTRRSGHRHAPRRGAPGVPSSARLHTMARCSSNAP